MAKTRQTTNNRTEVSEGPGARAVEEGGEGEVVGRGGEGGEGNQGKESDEPPPRRGANRHREVHEAREGGEETVEEK